MLFNRRYCTQCAFLFSMEFFFSFLFFYFLFVPFFRSVRWNSSFIMILVLLNFLTCLFLSILFFSLSFHMFPPLGWCFFSSLQRIESFKLFVNADFIFIFFTFVVLFSKIKMERNWTRVEPKYIFVYVISVA